MLQTPYKREWASGLWRSEDMVLVSLHIQREAAHATLKGLGRLGCCQFKDLNTHVSAFQRPHTNDVRRCEELERRLRYIDEQIHRVKGDPNLKVEINYEERDAMYSVFWNSSAQTETLDVLEPQLEQYETELREVNARYEALLRQLNSSIEFLALLRSEGEFFTDSARDLNSAGSGPVLAEVGPAARMGGLSYLTGVLPTSKLYNFERAIYRASRGNFFIRTKDIETEFEDPVTRERVKKSVFVVFFSAQRVKEMIRKICESNGATLYPYAAGNPEQTAATRSDLEDAERNLSDTVARTRVALGERLSTLATKLWPWKCIVTSEKGVYNTLNMFKFKGQTVVGEAWIPRKKLDIVRDVLHTAAEASSAQVESLLEVLRTDEIHPTFFETNRFTSCFQDIVASYGTARYKEINPAVFTIVTFPYLFGIMYGDVGHGTMLTLSALAMILAERSILAGPRNEIFDMIFGGRYLLFLMGLFAIYMGFLYNDCFSLVLETFGNSKQWKWEGVNGSVAACMNAKHYVPGCADSYGADTPAYGNVYPIGVDPGWAKATNMLDYYNSFKMKGSVIYGVIQMLLGIFLSGLNFIHHRHWDELFFGVIPEIIFLSCTFGWMDVLIIIKWCTDWSTNNITGKSNINPSTNLAPSLLTEMTDFFLSPGSQPMNVLGPLFPGQFTLQVILLLVAVVSIPFLLLPVPIIEYMRLKKARAHQRYATSAEEDMELADGAPPPALMAGEEEHVVETVHEQKEFSEVVIKQCIHTIEFVLGCVSNTASYLRLWALSLAHAELSDVFWDFLIILPIGIDTGFGVGMFFGFAIWLCATIGVLLLMEALSAFLHALRLHWVEFQNKFYMADGIPFVPFDIQASLPPKPFPSDDDDAD